MSSFIETCYEPIIGKELSRFLCDNNNNWKDDRGNPIVFKDDGTVEVYSEHQKAIIKAGGEYTTQQAVFLPGYDSYRGSHVTDCGERGVCHTWDQCYNFTDGPDVIYVGEHVLHLCTFQSPILYIAIQLRWIAEYNKGDLSVAK